MKIHLPTSLIGLIFLLSACASSKYMDSTKYMNSEIYLFAPAAAQANLLVYLPGRDSDMTDFKNQGLLKIVQKRKIPADSVSINATFPFYIDRSFLSRLENDVFKRTELTGYKNIWFIGNSLGALGSLLFVQNNPGIIKGIIMLGPYLGEGAVPEEIVKAGGLLKWEPKPSAGTDYIRDAWVYLKTCLQDRSGKYPQIFFLSGKKDRYHKIQILLAEELPADHVFWSEGGHDWHAWKAAFSDFINSDSAKNIFLSNS